MKKHVLIITYMIFLMSLFSLTNLPTIAREDGFRVSESSYQMWKNETWTDSTHYEYTYNEHNQLTDWTIYVYEANNEIPFKKYLYNYVDTLLAYTVIQTYDNDWVNSELYEYYYQDSKISNTIYYKWQENETWLAYSQGLYSYNNEGNLSEELWQYWEDENTLIDWTKNTYTYENNHLISNNQKLWQDNNWIDNFQYDYVYNNDLLSEYSYKYYENNAWINSYKYSYEYENEKLNSTHYYYWANGWIESSYTVYEYDNNDNILSETWLYDYFGTTYNYARYIYSYEEFTLSNNDNINEIKPISLISFPNPFSISNAKRNSNISIKYSINQNSHIDIDIFNIKGQKVKSLLSKNEKQGSYTIQWNGRNDNEQLLPTGIYLIKFNTESQLTTKKIILVK